MFNCVCVCIFGMAKPQLALIDELVKYAKQLQKHQKSPALILNKLDEWLIIKHGYSRTTRADYLNRVRVIVWKKK